MKNVMGIIHHYKNDGVLRGMTKCRCIASVPFGGGYRLVDFMLSNMVNAGICNVAVITSFNLRSLMDHLRTGKEWGLARKHDGLFILPAASPRNTRRRLDLEDFYANFDYIQDSNQEYVLIGGSNVVCNVDLRGAFQCHLEKEADITVIYREGYPRLKKGLAYTLGLETDPQGRARKLFLQAGKGGWNKTGIDIYLLKKSLLLEILEECAQRNKWDFISDILLPRVGEWKVYGYEHRGYGALINSVDAYYQHHMDLLNPVVWRELFFQHGCIYTKEKDSPPAKYFDTAEVSNSLIASGCRIEGRVINSILFRDVKVGKGAIIKNSIVMHKSEIGEAAFLEGVILDKNVKVKKGTRLERQAVSPLIIEKRCIV